jgi:hypothetical protein
VYEEVWHPLNCLDDPIYDENRVRTRQKYVPMHQVLLFIKYVLYGKFKCYCKYHHHCLCDKTAVKHLSMKVASKTLPLKVTFFVKTVDNSNLQLNWIQHKNMFQCIKCCCFIKYVFHGKFKCHCKCHRHCLCGKTAVKQSSMKVASYTLQLIVTYFVKTVDNSNLHLIWMCFYLKY